MTDKQEHVPRNVASLAGDSIAFSIGFVFYDPTVVIPAFVKTLTDSNLLVGLISAIRVIFITLPQIWAAGVLVASPRKKPLLAWSSFWGACRWCCWPSPPWPGRARRRGRCC